MTKNRLVEALKEPIIAFIFVTAILSLLLFWLVLWEIVWTVEVSFVLFERLLDRIAGGGKGLFKMLPIKIPFTNITVVKGRTLYKGHAFIALFLLILTITGASALVAEVWVSVIESYFQTNYWLGIAFGVMLNVLANIGLFLYLHSEFYVRK